MSLAFRRIIYLSFITVFLIATPLIVLYTAGYKFGANGWQKTGMFIIDSKPRGAKIYINGKLQQNFLNKLLLRNENVITTPAKIKNLLPGEYSLKVELNGYFGWQKNLTVLPGSATYAEDIYLFKNDLPVLVMPTADQQLSPSPDKTYLAIAGKNDLTLLNLDNEMQKIIPLATSSQRILLWSDNGKSILADNYIIQLDQADQPINLNSLIDKQADEFAWYDGRFYYRLKNAVYNFDLNTELSKKIIAGQQVGAYLVKNDYAYIVSDLNHNVSLNIFKISSGQPLRSISLPSANDYAFINPDHQLINLLDQDHQILYLVDPTTTFYSPLVELLNNVKTAYWVDGNRLVYANDFEIYCYTLSDRKKELITRISNQIEKIIWHQSNNYIIYNTDKTINVIELDQRVKRNIIELVKFDKISSPAISQNGDLLYFYAAIGNQKGLYKLNLQ